MIIHLEILEGEKGEGRKGEKEKGRREGGGGGGGGRNILGKERVPPSQEPICSQQLSASFFWHHCMCVNYLYFQIHIFSFKKKL